MNWKDNLRGIAGGAVALIVLLLACTLASLCLDSVIGFAYAAEFHGQGDLERNRSFARIEKVYEDTLYGTSDTTAWFDLVADQYSANPENWGDHRYWTLFMRVDSLAAITADIDTVIVKFQAATRDTLADGTYTPFEAYDNSSDLLTIADTVRVYHPVTIYGGTWGRFIITAQDSAYIKLELWKKH